MIKRYILVAAGEDTFTAIYQKNKFIRESDYVIAVDGGLKVLEKNNIKPSIFIGDNDSNINNVDYPKLLYKSEKDESDFELAISYVINSNSSEYKDSLDYKDVEILVYNATGRRLDHFISTIRTIVKNEDLNIKIIDDRNIIYLIKERETILEDANYKYISFFNLYDDTIITLKGFKYDLDNYKMDRYCNLCLSNQIIKEGKIFCNKPIIVIRSKD